MSEEAVRYDSQSAFGSGYAMDPSRLHFRGRDSVDPRDVITTWAINPDRQPGFPQADPGIRPTGPYLLCQEYRKPAVSKGGIILTAETQDFLQAVSCVGLVIAVGPGCYRSPDGIPWAEGAWCQPGDYVGLPKFSDEKWVVKNDSGEHAVFRLVPHDAIRGVFTNLAMIPDFNKQVA